MKLKSKPGDFRVEELLVDGWVKPRGRFRVYRVTKRKLTSLEAAARLADAAGVGAGEVGIAGLKDRQGVTTQYMSVAKGRPVRFDVPGLSIEPVGFSDEPLTSAASAGNAFEIVLRGLAEGDAERLAREAEDVREHGLVDYFGAQRFGNLRGGQGWIARELALGRHEDALHALLCSRSEADDERTARFKGALTRAWGDWRGCRDVAGRYGAHHSVFEHLARTGDFAGAFEFVSSRVRLIHLYAWQSHVWNRAVALYVREATPAQRRVVVESPEGELVFARGGLDVDPAFRGRFRLPGARLEDVSHPRQRELFVRVLAAEGLRPEDFAIEGVPGFQLKGEDRRLVIRPRRLRVGDLVSDRRGGSLRLEISFELPRGAYATLLVERLAAVLPGAKRGGARDSRGGGARGAPSQRRGASARAREAGGKREEREGIPTTGSVGRGRPTEPVVGVGKKKRPGVGPRRRPDVGRKKGSWRKKSS